MAVEKAASARGIKPEVLVSLGIASLCFLVFGRAVGFDYAWLDDQFYVLKNPHVLGGLTPASIAWAFTTLHAANWHPLTWVSLMLDAELAGDRPGLYHVTNVLLHAGSSVLLFHVLRRMTGALGPSAFVAGLFAVHPLHVESVAWIAERKDVLSGLLFHATLLAYVRFVERRDRRRYAVLLFAYACGLLAKPMLVSVPLVLLLLDYWPLARGRRGIWIEKLPLAAMSLASCVVTFVAQKAGGALAPLDERYPLGARVVNAMVSYVLYLRDMCWPRGLMFLYPHPGDSLPIAAAVEAAVVLIVVSVCALRLRRSRPYVIVGWLWYLLMLVPVIGIVQVGAQARADRYTYLPLTGIFVVLAWGGADLARAWPRRATSRAALGYAATAVVVILSAMSYVQAGYWRNRVTLFQHATEVRSTDATAEAGLAAALEKEGEFDKALVHFRAAVELAPTRATARNNLGNALLRRGKVGEAIEELDNAARLEPTSSRIQYNLAAALAKGGRREEAMSHDREAIRLDPTLSEPRVDLADLLLQDGRTVEAISEYQEALRLDEGIAAARAGLASALLVQGRSDEATAQAREALRSDPRNVRARNVLGAVLLSSGAIDEALALLAEAVDIDPGYADARANLATALFAKGRTDDAIAQAGEALRLAPNLSSAEATLGMALARAGRLEEASSHLERALAVNPGAAMLHAALGGVTMRAGRLEEAAAQLGIALRLDPTLADARLNLGVVLAETGQEDGAVREFEEVLRQKPGDERARRNLEVLRRAGHAKR